MLKVQRVLKPVGANSITGDHIYAFYIHFDGTDSKGHSYRMTLEGWHALAPHLGPIEYSEVWTDGNANTVTAQQSL